MFGCDGRVSASIRNARSRISGEYFLFIEFHPYLKNGTKVRPIQFFALAKQWRGIAMRTDKLARNYRAAIALAATMIWLRSGLINTP